MGATVSSTPGSRSAAIKERALSLGFDAVGVCDLSPIDRDALSTWLAEGYAAGMSYMERQRDRRRDPARIVDGARRAVVTLASYYTPGTEPRAGAKVARYAWSTDYHQVIGERLQLLAEALVDLGADRAATRAYVDAGPVPERELASRAGLGWLAKNTMLIHPEIGSYTFVGCVFTDLDLACDRPFQSDHCGSCRACLDACPTGAFPQPRALDARHCISYLTIEHRGDFDAAQAGEIGDWLFGCDVCQEVCPWNSKFATPLRIEDLRPRPELMAPDLERVSEMSEADFRRHFAGTAFERTRRRGLARNAEAVARNRGRG